MSLNWKIQHILQSLIFYGLLPYCRSQSCILKQGTENNNGIEEKSVTIGFLGSYGLLRVALGALPLAVEAVNANKTFPLGVELKFVAADIGTVNGKEKSFAELAIRKMTEMRDSGTVAFIGPDDICASEALVAAAWDMPIISYKCSDTSMSNKNIYHTFARTLPSSSKVSKSVVALLKAFHWNKFIIVFRGQRGWVDGVKDAIKKLASKHDIEITAAEEFSNDYIPQEIEILDNIITKTYSRTRVYVFIGEHIALVDFVRCLERRGLLKNGDYVVISVDDEIYSPFKSSSIWRRDYIDPYIVTEFADISAFRSVLKLTPSFPRNAHYDEICERIKQYAAAAPFYVPYHNKISESIEVPIHAAYIYDAVIIYARALKELLDEGLDTRNGTAVFERLRNRSYQSIIGHDVWMDSMGDAEGNYSVIALVDDPENNSVSMQPVGYFQYNGSSSEFQLPEFRYYNKSRPIAWIGGKPPISEPECGFDDKKCQTILSWKWEILAGFFLLVASTGFIIFIKHFLYVKKLSALLWKIDAKDIRLIPSTVLDTANKSNASARPPFIEGSLLPDPADLAIIKLAHAPLAIYKGTFVAVKTIRKKNFDLSHTIKKELLTIRELHHENIMQLMGACVDHNQIMLIMPYCARGSLEDVLANKDVQLDQMFVSSLINDLVRGLIYLHDSVIISHGNLRPSNCLIDSRWVLQIADFGLHNLKDGQEDVSHRDRKRMQARLWRAPELLRNPKPYGRGSQKGDVYSFALIFYETIGRQGPWGNIGLSPEEIIWRVMNPENGMPFRPRLEDIHAPQYIIKTIEMCWHESPELRPDIRLVRYHLKEMQSGMKSNIFDNMLNIMEKYASNLEVIVSERTDELNEEKKKTEALLHRMLPRSVAEALKAGKPVEAESFDCVTIYFSDIVGFTELSAMSTPLQIVDLLNELYTCCDSIISNYDVYKVETIGDAYMVVSGLPIRNGDRHASEIASMALHMLRQVRRFEVKHRRGEPLRLRIGIHSGHCVAGVVGLTMPRYCLFGDTVNTASRMESTGEPFKIHISEATKILLDRLGGYYCQERGMTPIKGKGEMLTYWLRGEEPYRRLTRLKKETSQLSFASSGNNNTSCRNSFVNIPDILRRSTGISSRDSSHGSQELNTADVCELHNRALRSYSQERLVDSPLRSSNTSQTSLLQQSRSRGRYPRGVSSAPAVTFIHGPHFI